MSARFRVHAGLYEFEVGVGEIRAGDLICGHGYKRGNHLHMVYYGGVTTQDREMQFYGWGDAGENDKIIYLYYRKHDGSYYVTSENVGLQGEDACSGPSPDAL